MKKKKKVIFICVGFFLVILFVLHSTVGDVIFGEQVILKHADYNITICGDPPLTAKIYEMKDSKKLIVVYGQIANYVGECYVLDLSNGKIGNIGGSPRYDPIDFFDFGFVSNWVYDGYPWHGELQTEITKDSNGITLFPDDVKEYVVSSEYAGKQLNIYRRQIILTPKSK